MHNKLNNTIKYETHILTYIYIYTIFISKNYSQILLELGKA